MSSASPLPAECPPRLAEIIQLLEPMAEDERREALHAFADQAPAHAPKPGERFHVSDLRNDPECTDSVGIYLRLDERRGAHLRISLGRDVQTLTRALATIFCTGFKGATPKEILRVPEEIIPRIVGSQLFRLRSRTAYYILRRIKGACLLPIRESDPGSLPAAPAPGNDCAQSGNACAVSRNA